MNKINIDGRFIGENEPVFIVAEIGINHNGDKDMAKTLIDVAIEAGCDAVKFQKRDVKSLLTRQAYNKHYYNNGNSFGRTYGQHRQRLELKDEEFIELKEYAEKAGILFFASAWDIKSADFLEEIGIKIYKIGSPDLTNIPLCIHIAKKQKPLILSTGMSHLWEVEKTLSEILKFNTQVVLLHCVSVYPSDYTLLNLRCIQYLKECFRVPVGYSGHEPGWLATIAAVALGACVIEKHITLSKRLKGSDHCFSLEPDELKQMVRDIRQIEKALGDSRKKLLAQELPFREKLSKSIVANTYIKKGTPITYDMLTFKSPGDGIPPNRLEEVLSRIAKKDIPADTTLKEDDLDGTGQQTQVEPSF